MMGLGGSTTAVELTIPSLALVAFIAVLLVMLRRSRQAEQAARRNAHLVTALIDTVGLRVMACDADGRITHVNLDAHAHIGKNIIGTKIVDLPIEGLAFAADGVTQLRHDQLPILRALNGERIRNVEICSADPSGGKRLLRVNGRQLHDGNGVLTGAVTAAHDITDLRRVTDLVQSDADRLTQLVAVQRSILGGADNLTSTVHAAAQWAHRLCGGDGATLEIIDGDELIYAGATGSLAEHIGMRIKREGSLSGLTADIGVTQYSRDTHLDGRVDREATDRLNIRSMVIAPIGHKDNVIGTLKIASSLTNAFDSTAILQLELVAEAVGSALALSRLLESSETEREKFERLLNALSEMGEGVTIGEDDGLIFANQAFCDLLGYTQEELLLMPDLYALAVDDEGFTDYDRRRSEIVQGSPGSRTESSLRAKNGEIIPIESSTRRLRVDGRIQRISVVRDIRLRRQWENSLAEQAQALLRANDELKSLEAMRADFLAAVSHDFRTPLTSIVGYLELVQDSAPGTTVEYVRTFLARIQSASEELQRRVETFLEFSRAERASQPIDCHSEDVAHIVSEAVETLRPTMPGRAIDLHISGDVHALVENRSLSRVFENLLTNAAKYSPSESAVSVEVGRIGDVVRVSVRDHGNGIKPEDLDHIFDSYFRAADVRGSIRGSGIGLAVARQLVNAMGGRIWAENCTDGGSRFLLELRVSAGVSESRVS